MLKTSRFFVLLSCVVAQASASELIVTTEFPGGSAIIESIDHQGITLKLVPGGPKERGWVCWWYFKLTGIEPGATVTLDVGNGAMATPDRAFYSLDNRNWRHTQAAERNRKRAIYRQRVDAREAWFAWGPPFVLDNALALVRNATKDSPNVKEFELCKSRDGRSVPGICITSPVVDQTARKAIWIQARQHAWECGASWVCEGFVDWLLSQDERAHRLRGAVDFTIIPIMDVDNVEKGYGGKLQEPHDHNRDWSDSPHWPEVAAAMNEIRRLYASNRLRAFIDLHNPAAQDRQPFFFVPPKELMSSKGQQSMERFLVAAGLEITSPLKLAAEPRESGDKYDPMWKQISKNWVLQHTDGNPLAVTLETPWNTPYSTPGGYRQVGRQLGLALERWLSD